MVLNVNFKKLMIRSFSPTPPVKTSKTTAFTLVELLVVISIIAILAALLFPTFAAVKNTANKTASMSNLRQLAAGFMIYTQQNNGQVPPVGEINPTWTSSTQSAYATAWYNSVPRLAGIQGLADFVNDQADFYTPKNIMFVRAAKYPATKAASPLFAVSMNSKLHGDTTLVANDSAVRLQSFQSPANTMIFQESGVSGDAPLTGQSVGSYLGQTTTFAPNTVARYNGITLMVMADGHVAQFLGSDVVTSSGAAYFPQNLGKVFWTLNTTLNANN
jgi:prepilin-type N-terminal cleavage/methylation domain-containing protein